METQPAPIWWDDADSTPTQPLQSLPNQTMDVAIVGAGVTGLTAALLLRQRGLSVVVLDMHGVGYGDTGRSTAHATQLLDTPYHTLMERFGPDGAAAVAASQGAAIEHIEQLVQREAITCQWGRVPAFLYSDVPELDSVVQAELAACRQLGMPAEAVDNVPVPFATRTAMRLERQGQLHPTRYLRGLADRFAALAGVLCGDARVLGVDNGQPCMVHTQQGEVKAHQVIVATHSPVSRFNLHTKIFAYRTYVMSAQVRAMPPPGLYMDVRTPYHYLRPHHTPAGELLLIGGADHKTGQETDTEAHFDQLERFAAERFTVGNITHRWSGQVLESADGLPFIGPNGSDGHVWVATGFAGNGITSGTLAAMILADAFTDKINPYFDLYSSRRLKPLAQLRRMMRENFDVSLHMVGDRLTANDLANVHDLPRNAGALIRHDGEPLAVYRDAQGHLHTLSPACPHMGCFVKWNGAEQSWDCPCHGSRFSATGQLLQGPAVEDLARLELLDDADATPASALSSFLGEPKLT